MVWRLVLIVCLLGLAGGSFAGGEKKKWEDPAPRKQAILKLFIDELVSITPGKGKHPESFLMGSEKGGLDHERPAHRVHFPYSFAMAKYEVTQELYHVVMGKNPARWQGVRNSADMVNWHESNEFCQRLTRMLREAKLILADERIRLPSEAEWEYGCRADTRTDYAFGNDVKELGKFAWYKDNSRGEDPPVGKKLPNAWGLYDMHGYVWEWCLDTWYPDYENAPADGSARTGAGTDRVIRGGAYPDSADKLRSAYRHHVAAETRDDAIGFRCVKDQVKQSK